MAITKVHKYFVIICCFRQYCEIKFIIISSNKQSCILQLMQCALGRKCSKSCTLNNIKRLQMCCCKIQLLAAKNRTHRSHTLNVKPNIA